MSEVTQQYRSSLNPEGPYRRSPSGWLKDFGQDVFPVVVPGPFDQGACSCHGELLKAFAGLIRLRVRAECLDRALSVEPAVFCTHVNLSGFVAQWYDQADSRAKDGVARLGEEASNFGRAVTRNK